MITIFFRYDDYSSLSPIEVDIGLIDIMRRNAVECLFAVIPAVTIGECHEPGDRDELILEGEKLVLLKQAVEDGVVELGLHGWNHRTLSTALPPNPSEFLGLPFERQVSIINRGYNFLKQKIGVAPAVFVPPWNSYDLNTLHVLAQVGITTISAHRYSIFDESFSLSYTPVTVEIQNLRRAIDCARLFSDESPVIGVMLHPYDFCESGDKLCTITLPDFERNLKWIKECADVVIKSVGDCSTVKFPMNAARFKYNSPSVIENIYPPFIRKVHQDFTYMTEHFARKIKRNKVLAALFFHFGVATVAAFATLLVLLQAPNLKSSAMFFLTCSLLFSIVVLIIRSVWFRGLYFRAMTLLSLFIGTLTVLFLFPYQA